MQRVELCILKNLNRKAEQKRCKVLHKKPKLQTCFKGGKISGRASKSPPNHLTTFVGKKAQKIILIRMISSLNLLKNIGLANQLPIVAVSIDT